jgi:hypothetical protein
VLSASGNSEPHQVDLLLDVCDRILGKCLCPLGDADAIAVASYVDKFPDEFRRHVEEGGCPYGGASSLDGVLSPVDLYPDARTGYIASGRRH